MWSPRIAHIFATPCLHQNKHGSEANAKNSSVIDFPPNESLSRTRYNPIAETEGSRTSRSSRGEEEWVTFKFIAVIKNNYWEESLLNKVNSDITSTPVYLKSIKHPNVSKKVRNKKREKAYLSSSDDWLCKLRCQDLHLKKQKRSFVITTPTASETRIL